MNNNTLTREELLSKPIWSNKDIMCYVGCSSSKAVEIHQRVSAIGGVSKIMKRMCLRDYVLKVLNTSLDIEIKTIGESKNVTKN